MNGSDWALVNTSFSIEKHYSEGFLAAFLLGVALFCTGISGLANILYAGALASEANSAAFRQPVASVDFTRLLHLITFCSTFCILLVCLFSWYYGTWHWSCIRRKWFLHPWIYRIRFSYMVRWPRWFHGGLLHWDYLSDWVASNSLTNRTKYSIDHHTGNCGPEFCLEVCCKWSQEANPVIVEVE